MENMDYLEVLALLESRYEEVDGCDFYQEIFPDNEDVGELNSDYSKPNAVYLYHDPASISNRRTLRRRVMLKDTWENDYMEYVEGTETALCSGLSYRGRTNRLKNAQCMNALIFDLDAVGQNELQNLFLRIGKEPGHRTMPQPTFIVLSGTGLHLYYVLEEPVDLFPNIKLQLKSLKHDLTFRLWDYKGTTQKKTIEYQGINQSFRMVGSINEKYGVTVRAFRTGGKVALTVLNSYVKAENQVDVQRPFRPSRVNRAVAAERWPEWYQRVVIEGNHKLKKWKISGQPGHNGDEIYNWWLRRVDEVQGGHRYFFMLCMVIYACKCDIPKKRLREDMEKVYEILAAVEHTNPLDRVDIDSAMEAWSREYYNFTIDDIEKLSGLRIERNKRNGRKQEQHMQIISAVRDVLYPDGEWRNAEGRPNKAQQVAQYRQEHPGANVTDVARALGISRPTVYKWWDINDEVTPDT